MPVIKVESKEIKIKSDYGTLKMYPAIENLTVEPSSIEQVFNHPNSYGYDTVTVKAVEADTLNITPTTESQQYVGLYGTVNVSAVDNTIDSDIQAGNIKKGINILGIEGNVEPLIIEPKEKDVNFYDYDGTLLYSYTIQEANALTELPPLPEHEGLRALWWNWDYEDVVSTNVSIDVGANYTTFDGKMRLYINIPTNGVKTLGLQLTIHGTITVDWGDGTEAETVSANQAMVAVPTLIPHIYSEYGNYIIAIKQDSGEILGNYNKYPILINSNNTDRSNISIQQYIKRVETGDVIFNYGSYYTFTDTNLDALIIGRPIGKPERFSYFGMVPFFVSPKGQKHLIRVNCNGYCLNKEISNIGGEGLRYCNLIKKIKMQTQITNIIRWTFSGCTSLLEIDLPNSLNTITSNGFDGVTSLTYLKIPNSVTTIGAYAFSKCIGLYTLDMSLFENSNNIPTLENTNALNETPSNMVIYVKNQEMYSAFTTATNWSTYTSRFQIKGS